jgi:hypothetical protein
MKTAVMVLTRAMSRAIGTKVELDTLSLIFGAIGLVVSMVAALTFGWDLTGMLF